jgi:hypothetical protein
VIVHDEDRPGRAGGRTGLRGRRLGCGWRVEGRHMPILAM